MQLRDFIYFKHNPKLLTCFSNRLYFFYLNENFPEISTKIFLNLNNVGYIRKIFYKSENYVIVMTNDSLKTFWINQMSLIEEDSFPINSLQLQHGFYSQRNAMFYGISPNLIYMINLEEHNIVCSFSYHRNYIINNFRFFHPKYGDFMDLLKNNNSSVYRTISKFKIYSKAIWNTFHGMNIRYHGQQFSFDICSCTVDRTLYIIFFDNNNLELDHFVYHSLTTPSSKFQIIFEKNVLYLCEFFINANTFDFFFHSIFPNQTYLFHYALPFQQPASFIKDCFIFFLNNQLFALITSYVDHIVLPIVNIQSQLLYEMQCIRYESNVLKKKVETVSFNRNVNTDREIKQLGKCCSCLEANVNVVFFPCGHLCTCKSCSNKLNYCPLCRENVIIKQNVYVLTSDKN